MLIYQLVVFYVLTYVFVLLRCPWPNCSCEAGSGCQGKFVVDVTSWLVSCFKVNFFFFPFFGKSFDACSMFAAKSKFAGKSMFGAKYFKRICICGISK